MDWLELLQNGWFYAPDSDGGSGGASGEGESEGEGEEGSSSADSEKADNEPMIPKSRLDEINARMKKAEEEAEKYAEALKDVQKSNLKEQEKYKELYEQAETELEKLKPVAKQVDSWKETMQKLFEAQLEDIPKEYHQLIPDELNVQQKLNWISKNRSLLLKPTGPNVGAGERGSGSGGPKVELTKDQKATAAEFGYTEDEYREFMLESD